MLKPTLCHRSKSHCLKIWWPGFATPKPAWSSGAKSSGRSAGRLSSQPPKIMNDNGNIDKFEHNKLSENLFISMKIMNCSLIIYLILSAVRTCWTSWWHGVIPDEQHDKVMPICRSTKQWVGESTHTSAGNPSQYTFHMFAKTGGVNHPHNNQRPTKIEITMDSCKYIHNQRVNKSIEGTANYWKNNVFSNSLHLIIPQQCNSSCLYCNSLWSSARGWLYR